MFHFQKDYRSIPSGINLFFVAAFQSFFAVVISALLFPSAAALVSVFLVSFGLLTTFDVILDENKEAIWVKKLNPVNANTKTALQFLAIFLGIFIVYFLLVTYLPKDVSKLQFAKQLEGAPTSFDVGRFSDISTILINNITVLYLFLFFSICYRAGAVFVIAWNASVWGATFGYIHHSWEVSSFSTLVFSQIKLAVAILPHLIAEASGYILAAMAGLFIAKGFNKYSFSSDSFNQVLRACLFLLIAASLLVIFGAVLESNYASFIISRLFD